MAYPKQSHCKKGHELTPDNVYIATHKSDGRQYRQCRTCHNRDSLERYRALTPEQRAERRKSFPSSAKNKHYQRKYRFEKQYGITVEDAKAILVEQGGLCAICCEEPATHLDHDHATGSVRGWLCGPCNRALGLLQDDPERLRGALLYLEGR